MITTLIVIGIMILFMIPGILFIKFFLPDEKDKKDEKENPKKDDNSK